MQTTILNDLFSMVGPRARPRQLLHDNARLTACWLTFCLLVRVACPLVARCPLATGNGQRVRVACPLPVDTRCVPVGCALPVGNGQRARVSVACPLIVSRPLGARCPSVHGSTGSLHYNGQRCAFTLLFR